MKKNIRLLLVILWMIFIFVMSSFTSNESSEQSGYLVNIISRLFNINNIDILTFIVRKLAHFIEYTILGLLIYNYLKNTKNNNVYMGIIICTIYSLSDELHQMFVPGRSGEIRDIIIDLFGSILGILIMKKIRK